MQAGVQAGAWEGARAGAQAAARKGSQTAPAMETIQAGFGGYSRHKDLQRQTEWSHRLRSELP